jgi:hypothetical protein
MHRKLWRGGCPKENCLAFVAGKGVEAIKKSPHACWGSHPIDSWIMWPVLQETARASDMFIPSLRPFGIEALLQHTVLLWDPLRLYTAMHIRGDIEVHGVYVAHTVQNHVLCVLYHLLWLSSVGLLGKR